MAGYLGAIPVPQATQHRESFTATSGQTTFATAGYTAGFLDVYLNGSHLSPADFTATNGSDVVLASGASTGDVCDIISYTAFEVADQTFTGTTTMDVAAITGVLTTTAATVFNGGFASNAASTITTADNLSGLIVACTDADANTGPTIQLKRDSSTTAANDLLGNLIFVGENDADEATVYANIGSQNQVITNGSESGRFFISTIVGGTEYSRFFADATETVINENSRDLDFRVESNGNANMLFVDGGNNRVGVGTNAPVGTFVVEATVPKIQATTGSKHLEFGVGGSGCGLAMTDGHFMTFNHQPFANRGTDTNLTERMRIDSSGRVGIGTSSPSALMHISGGSTATDGIHYIATNTSNGPAGIVMNSGHGNWKIINSQTVANALEFIDGGSPDATRMKIDSSGSFQLSPASNQGTFRFGNQQGNGSGIGAQFYLDSSQSIWYNSTSSTADKYHAQFINGNGLVGHIKTNGSATAYNTSSDYRLKTDAQPMTGASDRVLALKPVNFEWIADGTRVDGFLAHEAQEVVPEAVTGTKDAMRDEEYEVTPAVLDDDGNETTAAVMGTRSVPDMQGIDQSKMVPLLVAALQEALARITALEKA